MPSSNRWTNVYRCWLFLGRKSSKARYEYISIASSTAVRVGWDLGLLWGTLTEIPSAKHLTGLILSCRVFCFEFFEILQLCNDQARSSTSPLKVHHLCWFQNGAWRRSNSIEEWCRITSPSRSEASLLQCLCFSGMLYPLKPLELYKIVLKSKGHQLADTHFSLCVFLVRRPI